MSDTLPVMPTLSANKDVCADPRPSGDNDTSPACVPHRSCDNNATTAHIQGFHVETIATQQRTHGPFLDLIRYLKFNGLLPPTKK